MNITTTTNKVGLTTAAAIAMLTVSSTAMADPIEGEIEFGFSTSSGNSDTENLLAKIKLLQQSGAWFHEVGFSAIASSTSDETTTERYLLTGKTGRDLTSKLYAFGSGKYDKDLFSGFDFQATVALGLGYHVIQQEDHQRLDIEAGPGFRFSETDDGDNQDEAVLRAGLFYDHQLLASTHFSQDITVEIGSDNTTIDSETALSVQISDALSIKLSYLLKNNSDVPDGVDSTDTLTAVSVLYGF